MTTTTRRVGNHSEVTKLSVREERKSVSTRVLSVYRDHAEEKVSKGRLDTDLVGHGRQEVERSVSHVSGRGNVALTVCGTRHDCARNSLERNAHVLHGSHRDGD